jgi:hypothetical protein
MSFSSLLPRRLAFLSSSSHWIRSARTVSSFSAPERRVDDYPDNELGVKIPVPPSFFLMTLEDDIRETDRVLEPSKTESYLSSLLVDGGPPTLRDLERLKPSTHSDPQSKEYALEYSTVLDNICRSFTNDQLRFFAEDYGLRVGSNQRKMSCVEAIVEKAWRWPLPEGLIRARGGRAMISQSMCTLILMPICLLTLRSIGPHCERTFHSSWKRSVHGYLTTCCLTPLQDGSDLSQLSRKYNVHISVKPSPLAIYLEGRPESVTATREYIDGVRKAGYSSVLLF